MNEKNFFYNYQYNHLLNFKFMSNQNFIYYLLMYLKLIKIIFYDFLINLNISINFLIYMNQIDDFN